MTFDSSPEEWGLPLGILFTVLLALWLGWFFWEEAAGPSGDVQSRDR